MSIDLHIIRKLIDGADEGNGYSYRFQDIVV